MPGTLSASTSRRRCLNRNIVFLVACLEARGVPDSVSGISMRPGRTVVRFCDAPAAGSKQFFKR
jgi:hypothetical protein